MQKNGKYSLSYYPKKIASKAVESIGNFYDLYMELNGTVGDLIKDDENRYCILFSTFRS